jgi:hypothetical protein
MLCDDPQSLVFQLRMTWLQYAFSNPCLFHTLLFYASDQLDSSQGRTDQSPVTLYHYSKATGLIRQQLSVPGRALDECMIASVALLAIHAVGKLIEHHNSL